MRCPERYRTGYYRIGGNYGLRWGKHVLLEKSIERYDDGNIRCNQDGERGCRQSADSPCHGPGSNLTIELQTAVDEAFTKAVILGTYTVKKGDNLKTKVPYGDLGFMRIKYTGASALTGGTLSAALVFDADIA